MARHALLPPANSVIGHQRRVEILNQQTPTGFKKADHVRFVFEVSASLVKLVNNTVLKRRLA